MALYRYGTRYSRWDGTQQIDALGADDLMRAMSDELMRDGDLMNAPAAALLRASSGPTASGCPGLRD